MNKTEKSNLKKYCFLCLLTILSSFIFSMEHPNFIIAKGLGFLAWISYLPVLWIIYKSSYKSVWIYGFFYGIFSYLFYAYWLYNYDKLCLFLVLSFYSILYAGLFLILKFCESTSKNKFWFIQALVITSFEILKTKGFAGFSYGITAYSQWNYPVIIQICDVIGIYGLNFIIILFSCILFGFCVKKEQKGRFTFNNETNLSINDTHSHLFIVNQYQEELNTYSLKGIILILILYMILFSGIIFYGINKINSFTKDKTIRIASIQNNEDPYENFYKENIQALINLSDNAIDINQNVKIIVWPETSVTPAIVYHYTEKIDEERNRLVTNVLNYINKHNSVFVIGNGHRSENGYYNSALVFKGKKNVIPPEPLIYSKNHLVPFSEYFPYEKQFPKVYKYLIDSGNSMWTPGTDFTVFNENDFYFSTPICFEDTFPEISRNMYLNGSRCLIVLCDDAWSKSICCQYQHLSMAIFRTVENRIPMVRSSSSGQTCIINSIGKIDDMAFPNCKTFASSDVEVISKDREPTLYTKYGYFIEMGIIFLTLLLLIIPKITVIIKKIKDK